MSYQKNNKAERGIINLEKSNEERTHWKDYYKNNDLIYHFDSHGKNPPPKEFVNTKPQKFSL